MGSYDSFSTNRKPAPPQQSPSSDVTDHGEEMPRITPDLALTPDNILYLQRTIGNQAVQQLLTQRPAITSIPNGLAHIQRAWKRVPRRNFGLVRDNMGVPIAADNNIDRVYYNDTNPKQIFVYMSNGNPLLYRRQQGYYQQIYDDLPVTQAEQALVVAAPLVALQGNGRTHILNGENSGNSHVGLHTERFLGGNDTVHERTDTDGNGIYAARVTLNGQTVSKASLMYPTSWDEHDIAEAVQNAINTIQPAVNGLINGYSKADYSGFRIAMRFSDNDNRSMATLETAFPLEYNGEAPTAAEMNDLFD